MPDARDKILKAAVELFAVRGFRGTTTRGIASKACVNEGTIFKIFRSKRRLYREVLELKLRELADRSLPVQVTDPRELIKHIIAAREQDPALMRLILFGMLEAFPEFMKVLHNWRKDYYTRLSATIAQQKKQGVVADDVPEMLAAVTLTGIGFWHCLFNESFNLGRELKVSRSDLLEFYNRIWCFGLSHKPPKDETRLGCDFNVADGDCAE
jgi:AcrR family transcriptional regulator